MEKPDRHTDDQEHEQQNHASDAGQHQIHRELAVSPSLAAARIGHQPRAQNDTADADEDHERPQGRAQIFAGLAGDEHVAGEAERL